MEAGSCMNCDLTGTPHPSGADFSFSFLAQFFKSCEKCVPLCCVNCRIAKQQDSLQIAHAPRALDVVFRLIALPEKQFSKSQCLQPYLQGCVLTLTTQLHFIPCYAHLLACTVYICHLNIYTQQRILFWFKCRSRTPIIEFVGLILWWPWISQTNLVNNWVFDWIWKKICTKWVREVRELLQSDLSLCFCLLLNCTINNYSHAGKSAFHQLHVAVHNSDYMKRVQCFHNFICFATVCQPVSWR